MESSQQYLRDGIIQTADLAFFNLLPPQERLQAKRPVASIECIQEIPCNSCAFACKLGAIRMENVNDVPKVDFEKCTGCMACVMVCPGLAVFLMRSADGRGFVTLPYEFLPIPRAGDSVATFDREGKLLGEARVTWVLAPERNDGTGVVTIEVPVDWLFKARGIRVSGE